jgi:hypothetical protein
MAEHIGIAGEYIESYYLGQLKVTGFFVQV